jgi:hypothetical protein
MERNGRLRQIWRLNVARYNLGGSLLPLDNQAGARLFCVAHNWCAQTFLIHQDWLFVL